MYPIIISLLNACINERLDSYTIRPVGIIGLEWEVELRTSWKHPFTGMTSREPKVFRITAPCGIEHQVFEITEVK